jgi:glutaryl-CoA dehydrogenase
MLDFYEVDEELTAEERIVRDTVRQFVDKEVTPEIATHFRDGTFPRHLIPRMAELGLLGANLEGYGCAGMGDVAYGVIMRELERGDSGVRSFASVQSSLVMFPIRAFGSDEQRERWLPRLASGEAIGCFGLTEPDHGSDPGGMETRAERQADGWLLRGTKRWITNGSISDVAVVWAKTEDGTVRGFLVPADAPGFSSTLMHGKFSLRASITSELHLDDVRLPEDALMPGTRSLRSALECLSHARYGIAWGAVGAALGCFHEALEYTRGRKQFGRPLAGFQLVQSELVYMLTEITKAQLVCLRLGRLKEQRRATPQHVSLAKRNNVEIALDIARRARDLLGANGIMDEYACGRHMLNLESVKTYEGTHNVHTLILGQAITGLNAFGG